MPRLHVETVGHGPDLVLLHGWGLHGGVWAPVVEPLATRFRLHRLDLPGHGASPLCEPCTLEEIARRVAAEIPDGALVCGWSLGGQVALALALAHPHRVRRLALIATTPCFRARTDWPHGMDDATLDEFARSLESDYEGTLRRFLALQARSGDDAREVISALRAQLFARGRPAPEALRAGLDILRGVDLRPAVAHIRVPAVVIQGACDTLTPPEAGRWLAQQLPEGRFLPVAGAAHAPFLSHRAAVVQTLEGFFHGG